MAEKIVQTAGRDALGEFAPEFAHFNDDILFQFPEGCNVMGNKPYMEVCVGVHNIFKFLEVDYIHRLSYKGLDTSIRNGVRFALNMSF